MDFDRIIELAHQGGDKTKEIKQIFNSLEREAKTYGISLQPLFIRITAMENPSFYHKNGVYLLWLTLKSVKNIPQEGNIRYETFFRSIRNYLLNYLALADNGELPLQEEELPLMKQFIENSTYAQLRRIGVHKDKERNFISATWCLKRNIVNFLYSIRDFNPSMIQTKYSKVFFDLNKEIYNNYDPEESFEVLMQNKIKEDNTPDLDILYKNIIESFKRDAFLEVC